MVKTVPPTLYVARCECGTFSVYATTPTALDYAIGAHKVECWKQHNPVAPFAVRTFEVTPVSV